MSFFDIWKKVQDLFSTDDVEILDMAYNKYGFQITVKADGKIYRMTMDEVEKNA